MPKVNKVVGKHTGPLFDIEIKLKLDSHHDASIIKQVLDVDKELKSECSRNISVQQDEIIIQIRTESLKLLRTVSSSLLESLIHIQQTIEFSFE
jgi:tRNA threonylcarbamoyladenosine modification (KEOPS) complex  Pcc1 subunit